MTQATCPQCSVPVGRTKPTGPSPTYCSETCRRAAATVRNIASGKYAAVLAKRKANRAPTSYELTCHTCSKPMTVKRRDAKYCSSLCMEHGNARRCSEPGCDKPHRAKGLCGTHYNQHLQTPEQRHAKVTMPCAWCQKSCIKDKGRDKRYAKTFCDVVCAGAWRSRQTDLRKLPVLYVGEIADADRRPTVRRVETASHSGRVWTAGYCARCNAPFVDRHPRARYCSARCGKRDARKRNKKTSGVSARVRQHVLRRDGWRCQICKRMIQRTAAAPHPLSPSIDHVIPQSYFARHDRAAHDPANLRAAHFICNALRGAGGGGEQLALFG